MDSQSVLIQAYDAFDSLKFFYWCAYKSIINSLHLRVSTHKQLSVGY